MEPVTEVGALGEAVVFLNHFKDMPDPRQRGRLRALALERMGAVPSGRRWAR